MPRSSHAVPRACSVVEPEKPEQMCAHACVLVSLWAPQSAYTLRTTARASIESSTAYLFMRRTTNATHDVCPTFCTTNVMVSFRRVRRRQNSDGEEGTVKWCGGGRFLSSLLYRLSV